MEKNGGYIEKRVCNVSGDIAWITNHDGWKKLQSIFSIRRVVTAQGKTTGETNYYVPGLPPELKKLPETAWGHWKIESMHWMLYGMKMNVVCYLITDIKLSMLSVSWPYSHTKKYMAKQHEKRSIKGNVLAASLNNEVLMAVIVCL